MSNPNPLPNRQQLEEIDALLKRMLALPPLASEAVEPSVGPSPSPYAQPTIREVPPATAPAPGDPVVQAWRVEFPQPPAPPTSVASWGTPVGTAPVAAPDTPRFAVYPPQQLAPAPVAYNPAPYTPPTQPPLYTPPPPTATPSREAPSMLLWPMIIVNWVFDLLTYVLGPGGHFLRTTGRRMLGFVGLLMLVTAGVWLIGNWQGYDWPKIPWQKVDLSRFGWTK